MFLYLPEAAQEVESVKSQFNLEIQSYSKATLFPLAPD